MTYCTVVRDDEYSKKFEEEIKSRVNLNFNSSNPTYVFAIGGDGTIIKASHLYPDAIIFGVHTGHLGFYANYGTNDLMILIDDINNSKYKIEELKELSCEILDNDGNLICENALNEITIITPPRTLILDVFIDSNFFERFRGTGLCISTPSGSTAYNKSLGGAVLDPTLYLMQLTEMAGINSNSYRTLSSPLILSKDRVVEFKSIEGIEVYITVDHLNYLIKNFKSIKIFYKNKSIKMAHHDQSSFLSRIRRTFLND